jgi:hypothetical protein
MTSLMMAMMMMMMMISSAGPDDGANTDRLGINMSIILYLFFLQIMKPTIKRNF